MSADDEMPSAAQLQRRRADGRLTPRSRIARHRGRLNWLRACGARRQRRDRVGGRHRLGVAGPTTNRGPHLHRWAGRAGRGAVSMALARVRVRLQPARQRNARRSSRRNANSPPPRSRTDRADRPVRSQGLSAATAHTVAVELSGRGALAAHLDAELHIDPADIPSPVRPQVHRHCRSTSGAVLPDAGHPAAPGRPAGTGLRFVAVLIAWA